MSAWIKVSTPGDFTEAVGREGAQVEVAGVIAGMPMARLAPGVHVRGGRLMFGAKGLQLTRDNRLEGVAVETAEHELAILNDPSQDTLGTLELEDVRTVGQVCLLADDRVRSGHVAVRALHVERADMRGRTRRPSGFGVEAMQGAFTLWNRQPDPSVSITANLLDISAGSPEAPVRGSGVFVSGHDRGGAVSVDSLRTGEIHADGGIAPGTPDLISGGVFVVSGARVERVANAGPVSTYGPNDMVLDNWGEVREWTALAAVRSEGPSAIGFVNFGDIERLDVRAPIETSGVGARGFNLYDGTLAHASFDSVTTTGDGAVGIQVARELPVIELRGDLETTGGEGLSLVKGVQTRLKAIALSVQPGGRVGRVEIGGRLATSGNDLVTLEVAGRLDELRVARGIVALGNGSDAVRTTSEIGGLHAIDIQAPNGRRVLAPGR